MKSVLGALIVRRIVRILSVIVLLTFGTISFLGYLGNAFAYSDWYGLRDKSSLMSQAHRNAYLYFFMFVAFELAAFATTFSVVKWQDPDLSLPLRWLGRALVSVGIVVAAFVVNWELVAVYSRYVRRH